VCRYASGAILSIVAGVVATIVAVLGIIGAIALNRFLLGLFAIVITVFIILELVSGILGFVYRNEVESTVNRNARSAIEKYLNESDARNTIDTIQKDFECCGWENYTDWEDYFETEHAFPSSCECDEDDGGDVDDHDGGDDDKNCKSFNAFINQTIYVDGCRDSVTDTIENLRLALGAIGIAFAVVQVLVVILALAVCGCVHRARGEYTTV
jgi:hypothetical protein